MRHVAKGVMLCICLLVASAPVVKAAEFDEQFYSGNDVLFYDPRAQNCGAQDTLTSATDVSSENAEKILRFFTGKGLSLASAAGIAGNMWQESKFNPRVIQGGAQADANYTLKPNVGFGLVQWTSPGRQTNLMNYAKSSGKSIIDLDMQLEFTWKEITASYKEVVSRLNKEKADPVASAIIVHGFTPNIKREGSGADPKFLAVNPPTQGYEASGDTSRGVVKNRGGVAQGLYDKWKGQIQDGTGVADTADSTAASIAAPANCSEPAGALGQGSGNFTDSGEVSGYATVLKNSQISDQVYGKSLVGIGKCATIVGRVWQGRVGSAYMYNYATDLWYQNKSKQHTDRSPKKGSILIYTTSNVAGHVVIYLGNNKILNDGQIANADFVEKDWGGKYLGWIDPNDIASWKKPPKEATKDNIKAVVGL